MTFVPMITLCVLLSSISLYSSVSTATYTKMETMNYRDDFVMVDERPDTALIYHEVVFSIKHKNLDVLHQELMDRSTPGTSNYQKWYSQIELNDLIMNVESYNILMEYLQMYSKDIAITSVSNRKDYVHATAPLYVWAQLFNTKFYQWKEKNILNAYRGEYYRAKEYHLPDTLVDHINAVFNVVNVPPLIKNHHHQRDRMLDAEEKEATPHMRHLDDANEHHKEKKNRRDRDDHSIHFEVSPNGIVTPIFLQYLYNIPSQQGSSDYTQTVFETKTESYSPDDILQFQQMYDLVIQPALINDATYQVSQATCAGGVVDCKEGALDVEYIMAVSQNTVSYFWHSSGADAFVQFITDMSNLVDPSYSNSISWGVVEQTQAPSILNAFNTQLLILNSLGCSVIVSSGDSGVANSGCATCDTTSPVSVSNCACQADSSSTVSDWNTANGPSWTGTGYFPSFPASSPYVTAIGGTQGPEAASAEIACQADLGGIITSGGGFSTFFPAVSYQTATIQSYFDSLTDKPSKGYNPNGRAYPDLALITVAYDAVVGGSSILLYGTSASAPVFAGMVSLVNAFRLKTGKSSVGFLNPTLYRNTDMFNDITFGANTCCVALSTNPICCDSGFTCTTGWDPVTGLGSIQFDNLARMFNATDYTNYNYTLSGAAKEKIHFTTYELVGVALAAFILFCICFGFFIRSYCMYFLGYDTRSPRREESDLEIAIERSKQDKGALVGVGTIAVASSATSDQASVGIDPELHPNQINPLHKSAAVMSKHHIAL